MQTCLISSATPPCATSLLEGRHRFVVPALCHEQQPLGFHVMHHGDIVMSLLETGFIDAYHAHIRHLVALAGDAHIVRNAPPQPFRLPPQLVRRLSHWQCLAQRQGQRFEQQSKPAARAGTWYLDLLGLAAGAAINTWHFGVQPCLKLEKSKCRQLRLIRSWMPCPSTPHAGHGNLLASHFTSKSNRRLTVFRRCCINRV